MHITSWHLTKCLRRVRSGVHGVVVMCMQFNRWHWVLFSVRSTFDNRITCSQGKQCTAGIIFLMRFSQIGGRTDTHIVYEAFKLLKHVYYIRSRNSYPESHMVHRDTSLYKLSTHFLREDYFEAAFSTHPVTPYFDWRYTATEGSINQDFIFTCKIFKLCDIFHWWDYYGFFLNKNYRRKDLWHDFSTIFMFEKLIIDIQDLFRYVVNFYPDIFQRHWFRPLFYISRFKYFQHNKEFLIYVFFRTTLKQIIGLCNSRIWIKITSKSYAILEPKIMPVSVSVFFIEILQFEILSRLQSSLKMTFQGWSKIQMSLDILKILCISYRKASF
jgi:hypothetical protein